MAATSEKDISIIIVNYNVRDFLFQCLKSIENSITARTYEVIVVDNHSSDCSVEFLKDKFDSVEFISMDRNLGFGSANNIGLARANGKYTLVLNPDTIISSDTLDKMYNYMESDTTVAISGCKVLNADGTFQSACRRGFPTPWSAFSKLFGLQRLFPNSKVFAKYNQTYRDINKTYYIDAVIGAFMFCRTELLKSIGGFDTDYFMYGEDLDLCYRVSKAGWKVAYFHETEIIHFKGESTRRSTINEIRHFYEAMAIYARKNYSSSTILLFILRIGIYLRLLFSYLSKFKKDLALAFIDLLTINGTFLISTSIRFNGLFGLPDYAYPTVFIVLSSVLIITMMISGAYFENHNRIRRAVFAYLVSFFFLSSLTYFFRDYAFSRGVLLMTIASSIMLSIGFRLLIALFEKTRGRKSDRRVVLVGLNERSSQMIESIKGGEHINANLIGLISTSNSSQTEYQSIPVLGNIEYLGKIIEDYRIHNVIITDDSLSQNDLVGIISSGENRQVRYHLVREFDEFLISDIIGNITGGKTVVPQYNITNVRIRLFKRLFDIIISSLFLTFGAILVPFFLKKTERPFNKLAKVFSGKYSFIGVYGAQPGYTMPGKTGVIGLAHISNPEHLSENTIKKLNDYYLKNVSLSLDFDILLKYLSRK
jgi:GT2 family glycosyltransferase